jgi:hypothetical protein
MKLAILIYLLPRLMRGTYRSLSSTSLWYCHVYGVTWLKIVGSGFGDWFYWTSLLQLHLIIAVHTLNSSLTTNLSLYFFCFSDWSLVSRFLLLSTADSSLQKVKVNLRLTVYRQSVLAVKPLETHDQRFFFNWTLAVLVTSSLTRRWVCLLWTCLAFRQMYISHV